MLKSVRNKLRLGSSAWAIAATVSAASAQQADSQAPAGGPTVLPDINVIAPRRLDSQTTRRPQADRQPAPVPLTPAQLEILTNQRVISQTTALDIRRDDVLQPKTGANTTVLNQRDLENIPQGSNISVSDLAYQLPGVSQDSTSAGDFHVRNDHANVQYRINGIQMPDGVSGFSQFLETGLFRSFSLVTGALPAQYGLHTTGILDITTKSGAALSGGNVSVYGGSYGTITPSFEYGGVSGNTEYFMTGRFFSSNLGLENPTGSINAIHDHTNLERFFSYTSTLLDPQTRFVTFAGVSNQTYQIPNNPGQTAVLNSAFGINASNFPSTILNENQFETNSFFVAAWQRSMGDVDAQVSYYNRYSQLHFVPDPVGDLLYNGIDTDVLRRSFVNGIQADFAWKANDVHTLRAGLITQGEQSTTATVSTVFPNAQVNPDFTTFGLPESISDASSKFGWQVGVYFQDEWKLTPTLTLNTGLRFDQIWQYVNANQLSPRVSLQWQPWWSTVLHAGYARYFTPPDQVLGFVPHPELLNNTTGAASGVNTGSILPERSDVFDVGIVQQLFPKCPGGSTPASNCPALEVGVDAYYKWARDLLDDGQFGQAFLLSAFNYDKGIVEGIEFKAKYTQGNFTFYTNWAMGWEKATDPVSNQSFFDPATLQYLQNNWVYTDHTQLLTGSAGVSYLFTGTNYWWLNDTKASATMIYGSGLRTDGGPVTVTPPGGVPTTIDCPNCGHVPAYTQVNLGLSHEFKDGVYAHNPLTVRFDVVNLFDRSYEIRDGGGIGVFAPQFGPRRGYFVGLSQKF